MKRFKKDRPRYSIALIASLVLHVLFCTYVYQSNQTSTHSYSSIAKNNSRSIQLDSVKVITKKQLKEIKDNLRKQIVANELNGRREKPTDSKYAGEANQTFDRQTIAARNGSFKAAGLGNRMGSENVRALAPKEALAPKKVVSAKKSHSIMPKGLSLNELGTIQISKIVEEENAKAQNLEEMNKKLASESRKAGALGSERGSAESRGLAQNNDFVEDVPLGDMTNLNTTEFKYYGFYHRIRQKLEQHWGSTIQSKARYLYKSGRRVPASENLITAVQVVLDNRGTIVEIKIEGTSGIRELDQAAIESFNKAGPFPNPPKGLLVDGRAVIQWGFVVKS